MREAVYSRGVSSPYSSSITCAPREVSLVSIHQRDPVSLLLREKIVCVISYIYEPGGQVDLEEKKKNCQRGMRLYDVRCQQPLQNPGAHCSLTRNRRVNVLLLLRRASAPTKPICGLIHSPVTPSHIVGRARRLPILEMINRSSIDRKKEKKNC